MLDVSCINYSTESIAHKTIQGCHTVHFLCPRSGQAETSVDVYIVDVEVDWGKRVLHID